MENTKNNVDTSKDIFSETKKNLNSIENLSYLYPNGHRITPQMLWLKGSKDRVFRSGNAA
tara:strand:+ start:373 stop:552 length:180 start_codon:yes stop_codon:yes gene_type:complete